MFSQPRLMIVLINLSRSLVYVQNNIMQIAEPRLYKFKRVDDWRRISNDERGLSEIYIRLFNVQFSKQVSPPEN